MTTALITGGNKGIGYAIAEGLGALGWSVGVGARDDTRRKQAVDKLKAAGVDAFGVPLDVTDDASVAAAVQLLTERGGLDVLVNNAGITGGMPKNPTEVPPAAMLRVVDTNVVGVLRVTNACLPLLRASAHPRVVIVSSSVGSLTLQTTPGAFVGPVSGSYAPSKTFLNALVIQYAKDLEGSNILINAGCPDSSRPTSTATAAPERSSKAPRPPSGWRRFPTAARPGPTPTTAPSPGEARGHPTVSPVPSSDLRDRHVHAVHRREVPLPSQEPAATPTLSGVTPERPGKRAAE